MTREKDDRSELGGFSRGEIARLRKNLKPYRFTGEIDASKLRDARPNNSPRRKSSLLKIAAAIVLTSLTTWTLAWLSLANARHQQVSGDALIDDVAIYDGTKLVREESWEGFDVSAPVGAGVKRPVPFVTNARAALGKRAVLVNAGPGNSDKIVWPYSLRDVSSGILAYEASVYLNDLGPAGVVIGPVRRIAGQPLYDLAAIRFVNGEIRAWSVNQLIGGYDARRWYRVRVEVNLRERMMDIFIDGVRFAEKVPILSNGAVDIDPTGAENFDGIAFGGAYDGSLLSDARDPLPAHSDDGSRVVFVLDGSVSGWRPTGLMLRFGDRVTIESDAGQEIRYAGRTGPARTNPDGCVLQAGDPCAARFIQVPRYPVPAPGAWFGSLVARTSSSSGFHVGTRSTFTVHEEGELLLAYNDNETEDNAGSFVVSVAVERAGQRVGGSRGEDRAPIQPSF